jgi:hypothetical protein
LVFIGTVCNSLKIPVISLIAVFGLHFGSEPKTSFMKIFIRLLFSTLIFPLAMQARAGEGKIEGVLHGCVTDAVTKKPLSGVIVLATLPGTNMSKQATTDSDGYFNFLQLPAASVTVQFEKKGYQPCKRPGVTIQPRASVKLDIECLPDEMGVNADAEYPLLRLLGES